MGTGTGGPEPVPISSGEEDEPVFGPWESFAIGLEQALLRGDISAARHILPAFLELFQEQPLLFKALADGGEPRKILQVRIAQTILRALVTNLPRLGLLRETFHLLKAAWAMEQAHPSAAAASASSTSFSRQPIKLWSSASWTQRNVRTRTAGRPRTG